MTKLGLPLPRAVVTSVFVSALMSATTPAGDLSKYRNVEFGSDPLTVAAQTAMSSSDVKVVHSRPALIQELKWRPQALSGSSNSEAAQDVIFSFYEGKLFRIAVSYDRYETEGLTVDDLIEAISAQYGVAVKSPPSTVRLSYGDQDEVVARWQNVHHRFDLIRSSYGPAFRLVGVLRTSEDLARAAIREAMRLDDQEAPQRDAERIASEDEAARIKLEKSRLANKPKFRP